MQLCRQTRGSSGSFCFIADSDTLKPENVLHYTFTLRFKVCSHCLMDPHSTGQQGVALLLRLTSTRLFLAEDLLTAHLTLWSAHERQLTVADSWNMPSPISLYATLLTVCIWWGLQPTFRWQKQKKSGRWVQKRYHKGAVGFQPAHGNQWCLRGGSGRGEGGGRGQRLSIEAWFMIYSVLHVCSQVSGSYTQLEQQGLGVCFCEDKLKLDTFISASAAEELVTAYQKSFFFDHPTQSVGNSNRPWQVKGKKSKGTQNVYKAQS